MNVRGFVEGVEAGSRIGAPIAQAYQQRALMALRQKEIEQAKQQTALENEFRKLQMLQAYDPSAMASKVASNFPEDYRAAVFMDEMAKRQKEYDMMRQQLGALGDKSQIEIDRPEEGVKAKISVRDAAMLAMNPKTSKFVQPALQSLSQDVPRGTFGEDVSIMPEYSRLSQAEQQRRDMMLAEEQRKEGEFGLRKDELDLKRQAQGVQQSQFEQQNALERDKAVMQQTGMIPESIASAYPSLVGLTENMKDGFLQTPDGLPYGREKITSETAQKLGKAREGFKDVLKLRDRYNELKEKGKVGLVKSFGARVGALFTGERLDPDLESYEKLIDSIVPGLARGLFAEVGVLTEPDVQRYRSILSNPETPPAVAENLFNQLIEKAGSALSTELDTLGRSGYNVRGFNDVYAMAQNSIAGDSAGDVAPKTETGAPQFNYDTIKSGETYTAPDGTVRVKK